MLTLNGYIYIYIYTHYLSKVFCYTQKFLFLNLKVSFLMTQVRHHNVFLSYLPTSPLGQDMTQGQFLSGV